MSKNRLARRLCVGALVVLCVGAAACARKVPSTQQSQMHMGTLVSVRIDGVPFEAVQPHVTAAFDAIRAVDERFSNYKPESELSRLNAAAAEAPQPVSEEMALLLGESFAWSERTQGAFDCTVGPLVRAWGFFTREGRIPSPDELAHARQVSGWNRVRFDPAARTVAFAAEGVELDFGAIAKGYAVDRAIDILRARGVTNALVDAGGNFAAIGTPHNRTQWRIGIRHPLRRDDLLADLDFGDAGIATSGGYENYFEADGKRYVHIFDPRTGYPVEGMLSTTVIAPSAMAADALSTATFVLGVEASLALVESLPDTECLLVQGAPDDPASLRVIMSSGLQNRVHLHEEPGG